MAGTLIDVIEIAWAGPYTMEEVAVLDRPEDHGVVAIFGTHPVFGDDALLYIDGASDQTFAERASRVRPWHKHLPSKPTVYLGRLGGVDSPAHAEWREQIQRAARLLVFFHAPPWNARGVDHHAVTTPTVVLNVGRRHRLQLEVSTLWDQSAYDPDGGPWRTFAPSPPDED